MIVESRVCKIDDRTVLNIVLYYIQYCAIIDVKWNSIIEKAWIYPAKTVAAARILQFSDQYFVHSN